MNWGQIVQSHALSFFHLSGPDLLLGMDSDPATRNIMGLIERYPDIARNGIRLRQFGQKIISLLGGQSIHPSWAVPGGVREPLSDEHRSTIRRMLPEALDIAGLALTMLKDGLADYRDEETMYGNFPSLFMGLVTPEGGLEHYDGVLRIVDNDGNVLEPGLTPGRYREVIGEADEPWTYLKFPYYRPAALRDRDIDHLPENFYHAGMYRVGPLARLNVCDFAGTPRADAELREFRRLAPRGKLVNNSFHYHYARLIEIMYALERIAETVEDPNITHDRVRSHAEVNQSVGVGVSEAPRGTLFHEYHVNEDGILQKVNLIIATGHNNLAMNRTVKQIAQFHMNGHGLNEGILNRIEHGIRLYDPCLSCSTHAVGQMPMVVELVNHNGTVIDRIARHTK